MPIFEYRCSGCGHELELLVLKTSVPGPCPSCGGDTLERRLSLPTVRSDQSKQRASRDIRAKNRTTRRDQAEAEAARIRAHDDE